MNDYREELLNKILIALQTSGIDDLDPIRTKLIKCIGDYEITERCTELAIPDTNNIQVIKLFFATKRTEGGSEETMKTRWYIYRHFLEDVNKPFDEINVFDIRLWLAKEQSRVSLSTAESYRSAIISLFSWLYTEKLIQNNPAINIKPIKHPETIKKSFTPVEVDSIKSACKSITERAIVEVLLSSGLRCKELCNLKWEHINLNTKDVTVIGGKGNKNRMTMIDDVARKYLIQYKNSRTFESEFIFAVKYRGTITKRDKSSIWLMLKNLGRRAGISESNPHKYRHTFATNLYKRGMDIHMIQRLMGHSNINTTMIYIDSDTDSLRDAYKKCE